MRKKLRLAAPHTLGDGGLVGLGDGVDAATVGRGSDRGEVGLVVGGAVGFLTGRLRS